MSGKEFAEFHKEQSEIIGFWDEIPKTSVIKAIESQFKRDILKDWYIVDAVINKQNVLIKWHPRLMTLSDDEVREKYGE